jgi:hypothetical protein
MQDDIAAVKASASSVIDRIWETSSSVRLALVAYRDYGSSYVTRGVAFTNDKEIIRQSILGLDVAEGGDVPEAVYEGLLHAIRTIDLGAWRDGVKKVIVLMGDAPPHTRKHTLDEVVKAAEDVDPAHIFPITIAGSSPDTVRAFGEIARRTGGVMGTTRTAADLPREITRMVSIGTRFADAPYVEGRVTAVMGDTIEVQLEDGGRILPATLAVVLSTSTHGVVIAEGPVVTSEPRRATIELRALFGTESVSVGCTARILAK